MEQHQVSLKILSSNDIQSILKLSKQLNPHMDESILQDRHKEMFKFGNYKCFGLYDGANLVAISSGWITVKLYSGKQLEMDNVVVDSTIRSKGYGSQLMQLVEAWAKENDCETVELNTYIKNSKSHKFYFNHGYEIIGYHFQKNINDNADSLPSACSL